MTDSLVYCIVCAALLSGVLGTPFRVLHLYSVGYDVEESAISVEQFANSNQSLLQVYNITVENVGDVECDERSSRRNFILAMLQRPAPLAVLDGACPRVSEAVAEISSIWNIPQISYSPFSSEFYTTEQQLAFPNFFSLYPSQQQLGQYIAALLQYFSWTKVSVLYQQDYTRIVNTMITIFSECNITVVQSVSYFEETSADDLFEDEAHIYVIIANSNSTRSILCKAAEENIVYPGYTFITPHWYECNWWSVESHCTEQELMSVLNNTLSVALEPELYLSGTQHFYSNQPSSTALSPLSVYAYEGVQMLTEVLYHDPPTVLNFTRLLNEEVSFYNRIRAADQMIVYQYRTEFQRGIEIRIVATINNNFNFVLADNESNTTVWPDGVPPDGHPLLIISSVHLAVIIVFYFITLLGITFAIACLVFNFVFRDRKIVKLTSPKLNYVIVAGALWIYINLYFAVFPNIEDHPFAYEVLCNITYAAGIGTALSLGTIQGKMFRLFYIFRNPSPVKKKIKDWHIAVYVGVLVLVDIATYTTIMSVDALRPKAILVPNAEKQSTKNELQVSILYLAYSCGTYNLAHNFVRLFLTFGPRYVLDVISVILALISRKKIKVDVLNDAKYLQAIIYLHFINITIIFVVLVALGQYPNIRAICQCLSILEAPTDVLLFTFIPKMVNLYKDPNGEKIFVNTKPQEEVNTTGKISADGLDTDDKDIDQIP